MLEWAREAAHRLLVSREAGGETGGETGERQGGTRNRQTSPRGPTRAFKHFLREFRSRNDEASTSIHRDRGRRSLRKDYAAPAAEARRTGLALCTHAEVSTWRTSCRLNGLARRS